MRGDEEEAAAKQASQQQPQAPQQVADKSTIDVEAREKTRS
jgi:hypothetical protein